VTALVDLTRDEQDCLSAWLLDVVAAHSSTALAAGVGGRLRGLRKRLAWSSCHCPQVAVCQVTVNCAPFDATDPGAMQ
jgi:hypothetical protein